MLQACLLHAPPNLPKIKEAIFAVGAGRYPGPGGYTEVAFPTRGVGQFKPGETASPYIGERGKIEELEEVRFETICVGRDVAKAAVAALKKYRLVLHASASAVK